MRLDRLIPLGALLIAVGLVAFGLAHLPAWWWPGHALGVCTGTREQIVQCKGYNLFSGQLSDVSELSVLVGMVTFAAGAWFKHNCHVPGCWRIAWHPHPQHAHPVCRRHHPHSDPGHEVWDVHKISTSEGGD